MSVRRKENNALFCADQGPCKFKDVSRLGDGVLAMALEFLKPYK